MSKLKTKVCGMTSAEQIKALADLNVDYAGLIFYEKSPRFVGNKLNPEEVRAIKSIKKVGVFVNATRQNIESAIATYQLDALQLHGDESPDFCNYFNRKLPVFKAFKIKSAEDVLAAEAYTDCCTYCLFDTAGKHHGGNGTQFDWSLLNHYKGETPFLLSGGIGPNDAQKINCFSHSKYSGVDLNSQFEIAPGQKNINTLNTFLCQLTIN